MGTSCERREMFLSGTIFLTCLHLIFSSEDVSDKTEGEREGKVWYISTTTTSTTVSTTTLCMQLAAITDLVPPCTGKKKKRSFFFDESPAFTEEDIDPFFLPLDDDHQDEHEDDVHRHQHHRHRGLHTGWLVHQ